MQMMALRINFIGSLIFVLGLAAVTLSQDSSRRPWCQHELDAIMSRICNGPNPPFAPRRRRTVGVVSDMLRNRIHKRGIVEDCCYSDGCTYDELRDYCPVPIVDC